MWAKARLDLDAEREPVLGPAVEGSAERRRMTGAVSESDVDG